MRILTHSSQEEYPPSRPAAPCIMLIPYRCINVSDFSYGQTPQKSPISIRIRKFPIHVTFEPSLCKVDEEIAPKYTFTIDSIKTTLPVRCFIARAVELAAQVFAAQLHCDATAVVSAVGARSQTRVRSGRGCFSAELRARFARFARFARPVPLRRRKVYKVDEKRFT